jgi:hypothetical protein
MEGTATLEGDFIPTFAFFVATTETDTGTVISIISTRRRARSQFFFESIPEFSKTRCCRSSSLAAICKASAPLQAVHPASAISMPAGGRGGGALDGCAKVSARG